MFRGHALRWWLHKILLNALRHLNEKLAGNFDLDQWRHRATYEADLGCIQMFLESAAAQTVSLGGAEVDFEAGETIHTENSYKYHYEEFVELAASAGFAVDLSWSDDWDWFSIFLLKAV